MENKKHKKIVLILGLCALCLTIVIAGTEGKLFLRKCNNLYLNWTGEEEPQHKIDKGGNFVVWAADPLIINYLPACPFSGEVGEVYAKNFHCSWSDYKCTLTAADPCSWFDTCLCDNYESVCSISTYLTTSGSGAAYTYCWSNKTSGGQIYTNACEFCVIK
jgi:hypothetical protein